MAIAFDAATENVAAADPQSFTHTPSGTPRGVWVSIVSAGTASNIVIGVTYGGVAMALVETNSANGTDLGRSYLYFLGASIPTGAQTVSVDRTQASAQVQVVAVTFTSSAVDTEIVDSGSAGSSTGGSAANPTVGPLAYGGRTCLGIATLFSGQAALASITDLSGQTRIHDHDYGERTAVVSRRTSTSTSDQSMGWTATSSDYAIVAAAVSEIVVTTARRALVTWAEMEVPDVPPPPAFALAPSLYASRPPGGIEHLELWSDVECNGGILLAPVAKWLGMTEHATLGGVHDLTLQLPFDHPVARLHDTPVDDENLRANQVLRLIRADGSWTEHRIDETTRQHQGGERTRSLTARSIFQDLSFRGLVTRTGASGRRSTTPETLSLPMADHWEFRIRPALIEAGAPYWELGDVAHAFPIDVVYDGDTPMAALRKVVASGSAALPSGALEVGYEGTSQRYTIHIVEQVGAGLAPLRLRARCNLVDLAITERSPDQATRIYPRGVAGEDGERPGPGGAAWNVIGQTAGSGYYDLVLADPRGGEGPIKYDGQFLPPAISVDDPGTALVETPDQFHLDYVTGGDFTYPIIASTAATQTVRVATTAAPPDLNELQDAEGIGTINLGYQRARIVSDAFLQETTFLDHPAMVAKYGVRVATLDRDDIPGTDNLIPNPVARLWPASSIQPTGWRHALATISRETSPRYWEHGGQAVRAYFTDLAGNVGLPTALLPLRAQGYLSFFVRITTLQGRIQVAMDVHRRPTDPDGAPADSLPFVSGTGYTYSIPSSSGLLVDDTVLPLVTNIEVNTAEDIGIAACWDLTKYPLYGGWVQVWISPAPDQTGQVECVIHGAQLTITPSQMPLLEGNGGVRLHKAANARLGLYATPAPTVSVNLVDLAMANGLRFPYDPMLRLGRPIEIDDPDLDASVSTRLVGWTRNWAQRLVPGVEISNERPDIVAILASRTRAPRHAVALKPAGTRGLTYAP